MRVGHTDVLGRVDHHASSDETGVLSCLEHAGEPVHGSVGVRATDALDEGTDDVVVAVAAVADRLGVDGSLGIVERDMDRTPSGCGQGDGDLGAGERMTAVAARPAGEMLDSVGVSARPLDLEPPSDEFGDVGLVEGMETKQGRPRHQRRVDLEVRIFGGGADQHDQPLLDGRQQRVLLGLVEPVHLVEEQDRPGAALAESVTSRRDLFAHVLHRRRNRRQFDEHLLGRRRDQA